MTSVCKRTLCFPSARPLQRHAFMRRHNCRAQTPARPSIHTQVRRLAHVRDNDLTQPVFFSSSNSSRGTGSCNDEKKPDARTLKLGKTVEILHDRLPTLLASPLPQDILSPQITLHLFPSTHPHLPTVTGRIAYMAALWTAPVAWGRVPVIGNVKIDVESERMVKNGAQWTLRQEKLIVRWRTCGKTSGGMAGFYKGSGSSDEQVDKITEFLKNDEDFSGLFIFEFDEEGRIVTHTIEHAQEGGNWEKMTRVVSVTDWLIGLAKGRKQANHPGYALCEAGRPLRRRNDPRVQRR